MNNLKITLTEAGKLSRLNGYTNASDFLKDLAQKVGRVEVVLSSGDTCNVFEKEKPIPRLPGYRGKGRANGHACVEAFAAGGEGFKRGEAITTCPHNTDLAYNWIDGWEEARRIRFCVSQKRTNARRDLAKQAHEKVVFEGAA